jgi:hypothetical protein
MAYGFPEMACGAGGCHGGDIGRRGTVSAEEPESAVKLPPEEKKISAELLLLPPIYAEFMVETPAATSTAKVTSPEVP